MFVEIAKSVSIKYFQNGQSIVKYFSLLFIVEVLIAFSQKPQIFQIFQFCYLFIYRSLNGYAY